MPSLLRFSQGLACFLGPALFLAAPVALAAPAAPRPATDLSALFGRWQLDPARTHMGRYGPNGHNMVRAPSFTFIFTPEGDHALVHVYEHYPQPAPTRSMAMVVDGRPHACMDKAAACLTVGGDASQQSYVYHALSPRLFLRSFYINGQISEYSTYAVSADGQTFTMIAWSPQTPFYQNIQVFTKQP